MPEAAAHDFPLDRPPFMTVLGLLPPYELDDVKAAYRDKARLMHPDHGGNPAEFVHLKEAYEHAIEYVTFHGSRRAWIASHVETYLQQEEVIAEVMRRGGRVEVESLAWMEKSLGGGFPLLADRLRHVYVRDMADGDTFLAFLADHRPPYLVGLDVAGSRVSSEGLSRLAGFEVINWLNVSGTDVDYPGLQSLLSSLPSLEWINVKKTQIGWWARHQLQHAYPDIRILAETSPTITPGNETLDSATVAMQLKSWHP
jgi:hypothetical protein